MYRVSGDGEQKGNKSCGLHGRRTPSSRKGVGAERPWRLERQDTGGGNAELPEAAPSSLKAPELRDRRGRSPADDASDDQVRAPSSPSDDDASRPALLNARLELLTVK